ncbi:MAG: hypothetical protein E7581_04085 [Ruminococcaceae bacterium]|nr:hypothetical protein [Oscillospiraceae bacterium]
MKIKLLCALLCMMMLLSVLSLTSCQDEQEPATPEEGTVTRMTVDINPSVEFLVDDQGLIISATALNDDGSILIAGEAFVGKTPEEAADMMVNLAAQTGYLVKGNVEADQNTVTISISGDSQYAKELTDRVQQTATEALAELDISGAVASAQALGLDALRAMALSTALYTQEEIDAMDEKQLYNVLAQSRVETALLLTAEMREAYFAAKESRISFAEREETARIIEEMGGIYKLTHAAYKAALDAYSSAILAVEDFRYETLISPESPYQKSLAELRAAKTDLLAQKNYVASLEVDGELYVQATVNLTLSEEQYDKALAAYEALGAQADAALLELINVMKQAETKLIELEAQLFDENIEATLQAKASEIEANLNAAKDSYFAEFEAAHAQDIAAMQAQLLAEKQALKDSINGTDATETN